MIVSESSASLRGQKDILRRLQEAQEKDSKYQRAVLKNEAEQLKSLRIPQDERYKQMQYWRENAGGRLLNADVGETISGADVGIDGVNVSVVVERESTVPPEPAEREPRKKVAMVDDRIEWQESFDRQIRMLMVDFNLTDVPQTRLRHLERMHHWFTDHGAKQSRKVQKGPSYLTAERDGTMPPGSTKNLPGLSTTSLQLAGAYTMKSPRSSVQSPANKPRQSVPFK
mmetsp:Transcript_1746/g.5155  ORF Transcript_1746/g.5155 Transcript_1746/m.5155 type:complete len:227 (-) Transcript_1746:87-767(-)